MGARGKKVEVVFFPSPALFSFSSMMEEAKEAAVAEGENKQKVTPLATLGNCKTVKSPVLTSRAPVLLQAHWRISPGDRQTKNSWKKRGGREAKGAPTPQVRPPPPPPPTDRPTVLSPVGRVSAPHFPADHRRGGGLLFPPQTERPSGRLTNQPLFPSPPPFSHQIPLSFSRMMEWETLLLPLPFRRRNNR